MNPFPDDIFTEPDVDPDTLANLGPLRRLAGVWQSARGVDLNPKAAGPERREYIERIDMQPIDGQTNGRSFSYGLRYHTHINTAEEQITFHDQSAIGCGSRRRGSSCNRSRSRAASRRWPRAMPSRTTRAWS